MKKMWVWLLLFCLFQVSSFAQAAQPFRVGVLIWSMNIPGQVAMRQGLEKEAAKYPQVKLQVHVAGDGKQGVENQIRQMRQLISEKVSVIIVQPTDNAALSVPLKEANAAGIPVVAYDQYITSGKLTAYRTSDNQQAGFLAGEYLVSRFPAEKELRFVLLEYPNVSSTVERVNGFLEALRISGRKYRILKSYQAVEPVAGKAAAIKFLKDFPKAGEVDAVFAINDGGGLIFGQTLEAQGRSDVLIATVDGDPVSVDRIKKGGPAVINCAQFCGPLGSEAMKAAWGILNGKKVAFHALIPVFPVTRQTLGQYPGWMGPLPVAFVKPWASSQPRWSPELREIQN